MHYLNKIAILCTCAFFLNACSNGGSSSSTVPTNLSKWSWAGGSNGINTFATYGTQGVPSITNIPGARYIAVSWVDKSGKFWLFGGTGNAATESGDLNDMWRYNPSTKEWTWMTGSNTPNALGVYGTQGTTATTNTPGARFGASSWVDNNGNLWMFGGFGYDESSAVGALNDLWEYNISSNQWTWVSGADTIKAPGIYGVKNVTNSLNMPGARLGQISWVDLNGNLWMFGGATDILTANDYSDLWEYNIKNNQWTWVSGESSINNPGIYGVQGIAAVANEPGARLDTISWIDTNGNLWLFGGNGFDGIGTRGDLNDLWKYTPAKNLWTWMSGNNMANSYGTYGTLGVASQNSIPGAREHRVPISWADNYGNLWMLGGDGYGASTKGILNDLWKYNPNNNQWSWMNGSTESNAFGVYNNTGLSSVLNIPGARMDAVGFVDSNSNLWIFGGNGNAASSNGLLNDLWEYAGIGSIESVNAITYQQFTNYPNSPTGAETTVTGIRGVTGSTNVYVSGIYAINAVKQGFIYQGPLSGNGTWGLFNYPSSSGVTVTNTACYGPNNGVNASMIQVVGNYTTSERGTDALGFLYQGPIDGSGGPSDWVTLNPQTLESIPVVNTIAHSTMGGLVVGNYDNVQLIGKAFIYNISSGHYYSIIYPRSISTTAYGIWYNGGTNYTIVGGYSDADAKGLSNGYIVDYDAATNTFSNWASYNYKNQPVDSVVSHFEGITTDGSGGYNLVADVGDISSVGDGLQATFVHVTRVGAGSAFNSYASWVDLVYPDSVLMSANTVFGNSVLGVYTVTPGSIALNSFIATVPTAWY